MGKRKAGVKAMQLETEQDRVIGMVTVDNPEVNLLIVSEKGLGKRAAIADFRITRRGAKGVKTMKVTDKTGHLVAIETVSDEDELLIIKKSGVAIRISVSSLRVMGRNTQGVRLVKINEGDSIISIARIVDNVSVT